MAARHTLRASDRDREDVAERLRAATVEGRLLVAELEHRLERVFRARTYGELDALIVDLPDPHARHLPVVTSAEPAQPALVPARRRPGMPVVAGATLALGLLLTSIAGVVMSGFARLHSAVSVAGAGPGFQTRPGGFDHPGVPGVMAVTGTLVMIVFLVLICVGLGWLFSQDSEPEPSEPSS